MLCSGQLPVLAIDLGDGSMSPIDDERRPVEPAYSWRHTGFWACVDTQYEDELEEL